MAEYATTVASQQTAQVSYLTNDHLGSPRILTDKEGKVYSRRDFMPFGEEITANVTAERATSLNYGSILDSVRQKFTGYEREQETASDFSQARYYKSVLGRYSGPDNFSNDTIPGDTQSWNLYSYVRNNPLRLVDPTGEKALVAVVYDSATKTYKFYVIATFGVYVAAGKVSSKEVDKQISRLKDQIAKGFKAKFLNKAGFKFEVSVGVAVKKYSSESAAEEAGKRGEVDNIVGLISGPTFQYRHPDYKEWRKAQATSYRVHGESFDRMLVATGAKGSYFAHEFSHLLGGSQQTEDKGFLNHQYRGDDGPSELSVADYNEIFKQFRKENDSSKAFVHGRRVSFNIARANAAKWYELYYKQ